VDEYKRTEWLGKGGLLMPTLHIPDPAWREIMSQEDGDYDSAKERVKQAVWNEAEGENDE
jgi:hypothetical protein